MAQYIDKSAVVAEIKHRIDTLPNLTGDEYFHGKIEAYSEMLDFINTFSTNNLLNKL